MPTVYEIARSRIAASVPAVVQTTTYKPVREPSKCKSKKEYNREYYLKHREQKLAQVKAYRETHLDKVHEYGKDYYRTHREACLKKNSEWGKKNIEKRREAGRRCYHRHAKEYNRKKVEIRRAKREAARKDAA